MGSVLYKDTCKLPGCRAEKTFFCLKVIRNKGCKLLYKGSLCLNPRLLEQEQFPVSWVTRASYRLFGFPWHVLFFHPDLLVGGI